MAIEDILRALEEQAQADIDAVLSEAREHSALIVRQAEEEAALVRQTYEQQVERVARGEAAKIVNAARLEAKMAVSSVRGEGVDHVFETARERLGQLRTSPEYPELFARLMAEALEGASGDVVVHVDPADEAAASDLVARHAPGARVVADLSSAGGVVVESEGGRIVRRNTLEDRLDRARQYLQADVAKVLFA